MGLTSAATIIIAAFSGWNDAAESASDALDFLLDAWDGHEAVELPADDFYDYSFHRPEVVLGYDNVREIEWPGTTVYHAHGHPLTGREVYLVHGAEPNFRWRSFCEHVLAAVPRHEGAVLVTLGAMLADVPHTRPIPVHGTTSDAALQETTGYEASRYEGPTGILGVLSHHAAALGIPGVSLWAAVPHYVAQPPNPKATLALLRAVEDVLDCTLALDEITEDARAWQHGVEELAADDEEVADYVRNLEENQDTAELPEATGEAIAREFERYLRRRER